MTEPVNTYDRPFAKVIADSISPLGHRLTTMEVTFHRFVLAEFNTHRVFSRNSASSRAIPVHKTLKRVCDTPAMPVVWPREEKGMQGGDPLSTEEVILAKELWIEARDHAVDIANKLVAVGLHKSLVNRLLEPFMWHTVIVTSVDYENYFNQRCHPDAMPEIRVASELMEKAYRASTPIKLHFGEWHLPYISQEEYDTLEDDELIAISVARCARVSYLTHNGVRDILEDINLYNKLVDRTPPHESPLEHVASPEFPTPEHLGNFPGWMQWRHF